MLQLGVVIAVHATPAAGRAAADMSKTTRQGLIMFTINWHNVSYHAMAATCSCKLLI